MATAGGPTGLIDTDILIDAARGLSDAVTFLASQQSGSGAQTSITSAMELVAGCRNAAELANLQQFLRLLSVIPITTTISQSAYRLMESYFLSHGLLIPDALIGATALAHGVTLHTKNVRHFRMIPGLTVARPY